MAKKNKTTKALDLEKTLRGSERSDTHDTGTETFYGQNTYGTLNMPPTSQVQVAFLTLNGYPIATIIAIIFTIFYNSYRGGLPAQPASDALPK
ncbi:hypothetical protein B9Z19DRAFT_1137913 [Tuber borchii]|uniref:Uncharacterized protein n=1 Tax=Tuber borchii TaxID=42251 RepID=A0A2T6ZA48_TUBBO|nr:hypothetical protein B9Z19DRAFT_1137913 [Tuber borchii]